MLPDLYHRYGKSIAAAVIFVATVVHTSLSDGHLTAVERAQIAVAAVTALAVYVAPILPQWPWAKTVLGGALAVLNAVVTYLMSGAWSGSWAQAVIAVVTILWVGLAPAESIGTRVQGPPYPPRLAGDR
jgi:hypothetical protein